MSCVIPSHLAQGATVSAFVIPRIESRALCRKFGCLNEMAVPLSLYSDFGSWNPAHMLKLCRLRAGMTAISPTIPFRLEDKSEYFESFKQLEESPET